MVDNEGTIRRMSMAVGVINRLKVTCDTWHVTHGMWLMTCDTWFIYSWQKVPKVARKVTKSVKKCNKWLKGVQKCRQVSKRQDFILSVLLSAHAERVGDSFMRYFFLVGPLIEYYLYSCFICWGSTKTLQLTSGCNFFRFLIENRMLTFGRVKHFY